MSGYRQLDRSSQGLPPILEHRKIMQEHLSRQLSFNEVVHHKNGSKRDNRLSNLEIMSRAEHTAHHARERMEKYGKPCKVKGCSIKTIAVIGLCQNHLMLYSGWARRSHRKYGDDLAVWLAQYRTLKVKKACIVQSCQQMTSGKKGVCKHHRGRHVITKTTSSTKKCVCGEWLTKVTRRNGDYWRHVSPHTTCLTMEAVK